MDLTTTETALEVLLRDLAAFADPGTGVEPGTDRDGWIGVTWQEGGRERHARFRMGDRLDLRDVLVRLDDRDGELSYATFLASDHMGDLKSLARNTLNVVPEVPNFVAPRAVVDPDEPARPALELLSELLGADLDATAVVFLTADAGAGKTTLLTQAVRASADGYLNGRAEGLWLYVNAQGSRLARLDQALAAALDDLRARFPYHAAATLVRSGALVLVVDGFDELIGTQGTYDEAFSSLASFIERLRGSGSIVAAARSAYYEQEFAVRADSTIGFRTDRWALRPLSLCEWTTGERRDFLSAFARHHEVNQAAVGLEERVEAVFQDPDLADLASKPLFVSRVAALLAEGGDLAPGESLLERLVATYLAREAETKLLSLQGMPLLSAGQLRDFYSEIANEMWRQETRELSRTSLRELVAILADLHELDDEARLSIIERTPYSAVMHTGATPGSVSFEHEIYFSYFLSKPIVEAFETREPLNLAVALRKGRLPNQAGVLAGRDLRAHGQDSILSLLAQAVEVTSTGADAVRHNAGLIAAGLLRGIAAKAAVLTHLDFVDCDMAQAELDGAIIQDCTFRGVDLRATKFLDCQGDALFFERVLMDSRTRLELRDVPVSAFFAPIIEAEESRAALYAPEEVVPALRSLGFPAAANEQRGRAIDTDTIELVRRLTRIYEKTNMATPDDDLAMTRVVADPHWGVVHDALLTAGAMREEVRSASGSKVFMRMLVRSVDLLRGEAPDAEVDPRVGRFWSLLEASSPAKPQAGH
jgi:hypothetical protein